MDIGNKKNWLFITIIVCFALFFRLYRLEELFPFTMDEEYQAFLVKEIVEARHFPLIGVNVADTGLYLGSFFSYFSALVYLISFKNILGWAAAAGLIGGLTTYCLIKIGQKLAGKIEGLLAGLFYAVSFLAVGYDRKFWNPSLMPLFSLFLIWGLINLKKKPKYWLLVFAVLGLGLHTHYSILLFAPIIVWQVLREKIRIKKNKWFIFGIGVFIFFLLPLMVFDLRHNFLQARALILLVHNKTLKPAPVVNIKEKASKLLMISSRLILVPGNHDLAYEMNVCKDIVKSSSPIIFAFFIPFAFIYLWRTKLSREKKTALFLLTSSFIVFLLSFILAPLFPSEYYLLCLFPLSFLILAWGIEQVFLKEKIFIKIPVFLVLVFALAYNSWSSLAIKNSFGLTRKKQLINWTAKHVGNASFELGSIGQCHKFEGYRYLFEAFFKSPVKSYMDPYFGWLYPPQKNEINLDKKEVVLGNDLETAGENVNSEWQKELLKNSEETLAASFGEINVIIRN